MEVINTYIVINGEKREILYEIKDEIFFKFNSFLGMETLVYVDTAKAKQLIDETRKECNLPLKYDI